MTHARRQFICAWCGGSGPAGRNSTTYCSRACLGKANGARRRGYSKMTPAYFWQQCAMTANPEICWPWQRGCQSDGYGTVRFQGKTLLAHRVAWLLWGNELPAGKEVLHTCDNPPCVNPFHLYLGTQLENMRDRKERGRFTGEDMSNARWTTAQVSAMRAAYADGMRVCDIAKQYGLGDARASEIIHGKAYAHVPGALPKRKQERALASTHVDASMNLVRIERELDAHGEYSISSLLKE